MQPDDLVQELQAGNERAFETLVREHGARMYAVIRRLLRSEDDAQDALQDAFVSVHRSILNFQGASSLSTWLHRIAVNAALMKQRSKGRRPEDSLGSLVPSYLRDGHRTEDVGAWEPPSDAELETRELRELVRAKIDELPDDYRAVLILRDIEEVDTAEAARLLGVSPGALKTRLHRARQALRTLLERVLVDGR